MPPHTPNFDPIARPYRWLEYLTFGPYLERTRFHFLPQLTQHRHALILGDGDGRFTARLLAANPAVTIDAIDSSATMLKLLTKRATRLGPSARQRVRTIHANALTFIPEAPTPETRPYDLVVTHFFLDCLTEDEITTLLNQIRPSLAPETTWLVSEFAIPPTQPRKPGAPFKPFVGLSGWTARLLIATLYRAFQILTGLKTRTLPNYAEVLGNAGFSLTRQRTFLAGLLVTQLWSLNTVRHDQVRNPKLSAF